MVEPHGAQEEGVECATGVEDLQQTASFLRLNLFNIDYLV